MQNDLISIIVPVYKVEEYIRECLDSIINQTYTNLEIILVDDGSPDDCGKICDEYAAKDSRIKVIHQQNGGLSAARNAGLDIASGGYIGFVDSDDFIELNMYKELHKCLIENDADMSICGIKRFGDESKSDSYGNRKLNKNEYLKELLKDNIKSYACNKLYKRYLFDVVRFPIGELFEDIKTMHLIGEIVSTVSLIDKCFYNYRIRSGSITAENKGLQARDYMTATHVRSEKYKGTDFYVPATVGEFKCLRVTVSEMSIAKKDTNEYKNLFRQSVELYKVCHKEIKGFQKAITCLYLLSPKLFYCIKKIILKMGVVS